MNDCAVRLGLTLCLSLTIPALTQTPENTEFAKEATASATVANVFAQVANGVNVYNASATGKLTLVKGSPFPVSGQMEGVNGKYLISVGTNNLHSYPIAPTGAIGKQVASVNTQNYSGSECGNTDEAGAFLDHTGSHFYVQLYGATAGPGENPACAAWQSYEVKPDGALVFLEGLEYFSDPCWTPGCGSEGAPSTVPTVSSNDKFAYGVFREPGCASDFSAMVLDSNGLFAINSGFTETNPVATPGDMWFFMPKLVQADPSGHLAALMYEEDALPCNEVGPWQLASYTLNAATGSVVSTNTWENMPIPQITDVRNMSVSPSGKLLAISGHSGLQIFHFNGAAPITAYSDALLPWVNVDQLGWDNNNHLYVLSYAETSSLLSWGGIDATDVKVTGTDGSSYPVQCVDGSCGGEQFVSPKTSTTYTITGTGEYTGGPLSATATVTVNSKPLTSKPAPPNTGGSNTYVAVYTNPSVLNTASQLYVYTVTPTSITPAAGSPYTIPTAYGIRGLIVVPK